MLPAIEEYLVRRYKFISHDDMVDGVALTQSMPGVIAVNISTYLGMKIAGFTGAFVATLGVAIPPFVVISLLVVLLDRLGDMAVLDQIFSGVRAAVAALILVSAIKMAKKIMISKLAQVLTFVSFLFLAFSSVDAILIIILGGLLGVLLSFVNTIKQKKLTKEAKQ